MKNAHSKPVVHARGQPAYCLAVARINYIKLKIRQPNMAGCLGFGPQLLPISGAHTAYMSSYFFMAVVTNLPTRRFVM